MSSNDPNLAPDPLPKQFVVSRVKVDVPAGWVGLFFAGWVVQHSPSLPAVWLHDRAGERVGLVLGWMLHEGRLAPDGSAITLADPIDAFSFNRIGHCGRYACLVHEGDRTLFFLDPGGGLPAVVSPRHQIVAATTNLVPRDQGVATDPELQNAFRIPERKGWMPFGLTPLANVWRLLPNHVLCLETFTAQRAWPPPAASGSPPPQDRPPADPVRFIAERVRENALDIVASGRPDIHLTAGRDTRMVLACLRHHLDEVDFFTVRSPGQGGKLDVHGALSLARKFGLRHRVVEYLPAAADDLKAWYAKTGYCISDSVASLCTTIRMMQQTTLSITGTGGEVGRAFYWQPNDLEVQSLSAADLVERLAVPSTPACLRAAERWLGGLPELRPTEILDILYLEQRLGCWAGPSVYGTPSAYPSISPFYDGAVFRATLALPAEDRYAQAFCTAFLDHLWPELLDVPFNQAQGLAKLRFVGAEVKSLIPPGMKARLKQVRSTRWPLRPQS